MSRITNNTQLRERITTLRRERANCENKLAEHAREGLDLLTNPAPIIKRTVKDLAGGKNFKTELLSLGLSFASRYLGGRMGAAGAAGSSLLSMLADKFVAAQGENPGGIAGMLARLISRVKKQ